MGAVCGNNSHKKLEKHQSEFPSSQKSQKNQDLFLEQLAFQIDHNEDEITHWLCSEKLNEYLICRKIIISEVGDKCKMLDETLKMNIANKIYAKISNFETIGHINTEKINQIILMMNKTLEQEILKLNEMEIEKLSNKNIPLSYLMTMFEVFQIIRTYDNEESIKDKTIWWDRLKKGDISFDNYPSKFISLAGKIKFEIDLEFNHNKKYITKFPILKNPLRLEYNQNLLKKSKNLSNAQDQLRIKDNSMDYEEESKRILNEIYKNANSTFFKKIDELSSKCENLTEEEEDLTKITIKTSLFKNFKRKKK